MGKRLLAEAAGAIVFVVVFRTAIGWEQSPVRAFALEARERIAEEAAQLVETLRFRNAVRRTLDNLNTTEEVGL